MAASLPIRTVEKVWGCDVLPPPFVAPEGKRIGEIWFEPAPGLDDLLVKYLFTSEKLSVQVHPPGPQGKEEIWLVTAAEPGATLGIGFHDALDVAAMRAAALDGSIEQLMVWHAVKPGDYIYIPAGTVHAIGSGVSLIEVQQNNDITYRLYDYGRPRELHLDESLAVAKGEPVDPAQWGHLPEQGHVTLADGPWFRLDRVDGQPDAQLTAAYSGPLLVIPLKGDFQIKGESLSPGECGLASSLDSISFADGQQCLLAKSCKGGS